MLDRDTAATYARWFRSLADPTRLQLLHLLATSDRPMTVGELVDALGVGQSTVSAHVRRLAELRWVFVEPVGTATHVRMNTNCLTEFPTAADVVMGRLPVPAPPPSHEPVAVPWSTAAAQAGGR